MQIVQDRQSLVSLHRSDLDVKSLLRWSLLLLHLLQQVILLVRIRVVDASDRDSVVDACLVDGRGQGVLRELEARGGDESDSSVFILLTGSFEQLPNLLGPTCSSLPEFFSPVFELLSRQGRLIGKCLLDAGSNGFIVVDLLNLRVLKVCNPQPSRIILSRLSSLSILSRRAPTAPTAWVLALLLLMVHFRKSSTAASMLRRTVPVVGARIVGVGRLSAHTASHVSLGFR